MTEADRVFSRFPDFIKEYIYSRSWTELREVQLDAARVIFETNKNLLISSSAATTGTPYSTALIRPTATLRNHSHSTIPRHHIQNWHIGEPCSPTRKRRNLMYRYSPLRTLPRSSISFWNTEDSEAMVCSDEKTPTTDFSQLRPITWERDI